MPPDADWSRISDVFDAVADLPEAERPDALDLLCRDADGAPDPALRAEVEALLAADAQAETDASFRLVDVAHAAALVDDGPVAGERVGPWRVVRPIGRGGMGRVDLVERADGAYEQRAALKRLALVAPGRVRRFLRERQILARLDHPGIARLLDGGVAEDGAPYLVMEYVEGAPITDYAQAHGLDLRDRLELFAQVCDAVAYAHRHLVVHRDLKPSNVFVTEEQEAEVEGLEGASSDPSTPGIKLLDFGIARLLDPDGDEEPVTAPLTDGAGAPLTPGYAAPEQVAGEAVTTATDVYALGVLLYELLTGRRPHPVDTRQAWVQALLHQTPSPPSQTVSGSPAATSRRLRGDLDAITLTALRREPEARYATAHEFAADLRRYLTGEPVEARRPSAGYRLRRFVGRHRTATAAAALVLLSIGMGVVATLWQAREARAAAAESEAVVAFLADLFGAGDPGRSVRRDTLRVGELLLDGAETARTRLGDQPRVQGRVLLTIGSALNGAQRWTEARPILADAFAAFEAGGAAPSARADALAGLSTAELRGGDYDRAVATARQARALATEPRAAARADLALANAILNAEGVVEADEDPRALIAAATAVYRRLDDHDALIRIEQQMAQASINDGATADALVHYRAAQNAARAADAGAILRGDLVQGVAMTHLFAQDAAAALAAADSAVAFYERDATVPIRLGQALAVRGQALRRLGRLDEAEASLRAVLALDYSQRAGAAAMPLGSLATVLDEKGDLAGALEAQRESYALLRDQPRAAVRAQSAIKLAGLLTRSGAPGEAVETLLDARQALDDDTVLSATGRAFADRASAAALAEAYAAWGRPEAAARWERAASSQNATAPGH